MKHQELQTDQTTFLIDKLSEGLPPHQYIRELVQNSIEANASKIVIDVCWPLVEQYGWKMMVIDNGHGMKPSEMEKHLGNLASSGKTQGLRDNFGIGAKVAALTHSPQGLIYYSRINEESLGYQAHLAKKDDKYVLLQQHNGMFNSPVSDGSSLKPDIIETQGTSVIILGKGNSENTYLPEGMQTEWVGYYLNDRYFELPNNVELRYRKFVDPDPQKWPRTKNHRVSNQSSDAMAQSLMLQVPGIKYYWGISCIERGITELSFGKVHWWIIGDKWRGRGYKRGGCVGVLWRHEIYHLRRNPGHIYVQRPFGIAAGNGKIILLIEPHEHDVSSDTQRGGLRVNGKPADTLWEEWGNEFHNHMPPPLKLYVEKQLENKYKNDPKTIEKRVRNSLRETNPYRYIPSDKGKFLADGTSTAGDQGTSDIDLTSDNRPPVGPSNSGENDIFKAFEDASGIEARRTKPSTIVPTVQWESHNHPDYPMLKDRAATYDGSNNIITANKDFRLFLILKESLNNKYENHPAVEEMADNIIRDWFGTQLAEGVTRIKQLTSTNPERQWTPRDTDKALSEESLTMLCQSVILTQRQIERELTKLVKRFKVPSGEDNSEENV